MYMQHMQIGRCDLRPAVINDYIFKPFIIKKNVQKTICMKYWYKMYEHIRYH